MNGLIIGGAVVPRLSYEFIYAPGCRIDAAWVAPPAQTRLITSPSLPTANRVSPSPGGTDPTRS